MTAAIEPDRPRDTSDIAELTRRLFRQSKDLAETEVQKIRMETEKRIDIAQRGSAAGAVTIAFGTLLIGALGAGLVLWLGSLIGYVAACFLLSGGFAVMMAPAIIYLRNTFKMLADPTSDPGPDLLSPNE